jgi:hypothetical protein
MELDWVIPALPGPALAVGVAGREERKTGAVYIFPPRALLMASDLAYMLVR